MRTYKGRNRQEHEAFVMDNPDYYTVVMYRGHVRFQAATLEEAKALAKHYMLGLEREDTQAARIYATKGQDGVLVGTYHPVKGFKPIDLW